jgi:hypothetical protein
MHCLHSNGMGTYNAFPAPSSSCSALPCFIRTRHQLGAQHAQASSSRIAPNLRKRDRHRARPGEFQQQLLYTRHDSPCVLQSSSLESSPSGSNYPLEKTKVSHIHRQTPTQTHTHTHTHTRTHTHTHNTHTHIHTHANKNTHRHARACRRTQRNTHVNACTAHKVTCMHTLHSLNANHERLQHS